MQASLKTVGNGRFQVLKKLGAGSFGDIYLGYDTTMKEEVAIKLVLHHASFHCTEVLCECRSYTTPDLHSLLSKPKYMRFCKKRARVSRLSCFVLFMTQWTRSHHWYSSCTILWAWAIRECHGDGSAGIEFGGLRHVLQFCLHTITCKHWNRICSTFAVANSRWKLCWCLLIKWFVCFSCLLCLVQFILLFVMVYWLLHVVIVVGIAIRTRAFSRFVASWCQTW